MSLYTATACINEQALQHNFNVIKQKAPNANVLAVLKANAYGHGLAHIAKKLVNADAFGVARIDEALALRVAGVVKPIVLLEGFFCQQELEIILVNNLEVVIHNSKQLKAICNGKLNKPIKVWLKIDTGMHRLGILPNEFEHFYQQLKANSNVQNDIIIMSHLACADDIESPVTQQQLNSFLALSSIDENYNKDINKRISRSMANSAGICAWPQSHFDWVRPGIMLYGVSPLLGQSAEQLNLKPVMTLQSSLIAVRDITAGDTVGYGASWKSEQATTIGTVAIGYGDGYPRHAENGTSVLINGRIVPLVGRVSMDMITVDLGNSSTDKIGDVVTLWGEGLPIEHIAQSASTIAYELLCNITQRVKITFK